MNIGFALCGSFCTFSQVIPIIEKLACRHNIIPIMSDCAYTTDTRFGTAAEHIQRITDICGKPPLHTIAEVEPIGPQKLLDVLVVAPCTGNTLAKLAHSIADGPVTMAVKSHMRNARPVVLAISTNDALAGAAENIGRLLGKKYYYFVPYRQDAPDEKPTSIVADFSMIPETLVFASDHKQIQPLQLKHNNF